MHYRKHQLIKAALSGIGSYKLSGASPAERVPPMRRNWRRRTGSPQHGNLDPSPEYWGPIQIPVLFASVGAYSAKLIQADPVAVRPAGRPARRGSGARLRRGRSPCFRLGPAAAFVSGARSCRGAACLFPVLPPPWVAAVAARPFAHASAPRPQAGCGAGRGQNAERVAVVHPGGRRMDFVRFSGFRRPVLALFGYCGGGVCLPVV